VALPADHQLADRTLSRAIGENATRQVCALGLVAISMPGSDIWRATSLTARS
jgi:hypothetical protein